MDFFSIFICFSLHSTLRHDAKTFFFQLTLILKMQKRRQVPIIILIETTGHLHPHFSYLFRSLQKEHLWPLRTNWICLGNGPHQKERLRTFNLSYFQAVFKDHSTCI